VKVKSSADIIIIAAASGVETEQSAHDAADEPAANPAGDGSVWIKFFYGGSSPKLPPSSARLKHKVDVGTA